MPPAHPPHPTLEQLLVFGAAFKSKWLLEKCSSVLHTGPHNYDEISLKTEIKRKCARREFFSRPRHTNGSLCHRTHPHPHPNRPLPSNPLLGSHFHKCCKPIRTLNTARRNSSALGKCCASSPADWIRLFFFFLRLCSSADRVPFDPDGTQCGATFAGQ